MLSRTPPSRGRALTPSQAQSRAQAPSPMGHAHARDAATGLVFDAIAITSGQTTTSTGEGAEREGTGTGKKMQTRAYVEQCCMRREFMCVMHAHVLTCASCHLARSTLLLHNCPLSHRNTRHSQHNMPSWSADMPMRYKERARVWRERKRSVSRRRRRWRR